MKYIWMIFLFALALGFVPAAQALESTYAPIITGTEDVVTTAASASSNGARDDLLVRKLEGVLYNTTALGQKMEAYNGFNKTNTELIGKLAEAMSDTNRKVADVDTKVGRIDKNVVGLYGLYGHVDKAWDDQTTNFRIVIGMLAAIIIGGGIYIFRNRRREA